MQIEIKPFGVPSTGVCVDIDNYGAQLYQSGSTLLLRNLKSGLIEDSTSVCNAESYNSHLKVVNSDGKGNKCIIQFGDEFVEFRCSKDGKTFVERLNSKKIGELSTLTMSFSNPRMSLPTFLFYSRKSRNSIQCVNLTNILERKDNLENSGKIKELFIGKKHKHIKRGSHVRVICGMPNENIVCAGHTDGIVRVWNYDTLLNEGSMNGAEDELQTLNDDDESGSQMPESNSSGKQKAKAMLLVSINAFPKGMKGMRRMHRRRSIIGSVRRQPIVQNPISGLAFSPIPIHLNRGRKDLLVEGKTFINKFSTIKNMGIEKQPGSIPSRHHTSDESEVASQMSTTGSTRLPTGNYSNDLPYSDSISIHLLGVTSANVLRVFKLSTDGFVLGVLCEHVFGSSVTIEDISFHPTAPVIFVATSEINMDSTEPYTTVHIRSLLDGDMTVIGDVKNIVSHDDGMNSTEMEYSSPEFRRALLRPASSGEGVLFSTGSLAGRVSATMNSPPDQIGLNVEVKKLGSLEIEKNAELLENLSQENSPWYYTVRQSFSPGWAGKGLYPSDRTLVKYGPIGADNISIPMENSGRQYLLPMKVVPSFDNKMVYVLSTTLENSENSDSNIFTMEAVNLSGDEDKEDENEGKKLFVKDLICLVDGNVVTVSKDGSSVLMSKDVWTPAAEKMVVASMKSSYCINRVFEAPIPPTKSNDPSKPIHPVFALVLTSSNDGLQSIAFTRNFNMVDLIASGTPIMHKLYKNEKLIQLEWADESWYQKTDAKAPFFFIRTTSRLLFYKFPFNLIWEVPLSFDSQSTTNPKKTLHNVTSVKWCGPGVLVSTKTHIFGVSPWECLKNGRLSVQIVGSLVSSSMFSDDGIIYHEWSLEAVTNDHLLLSSCGSPSQTSIKTIWRPFVALPVILSFVVSACSDSSVKHSLISEYVKKLFPSQSLNQKECQEGLRPSSAIDNHVLSVLHVEWPELAILLKSHVEKSSNSFGMTPHIARSLFMASAIDSRNWKLALSSALGSQSYLADSNNRNREVVSDENGKFLFSLAEIALSMKQFDIALRCHNLRKDNWNGLLVCLYSASMEQLTNFKDSIKSPSSCNRVSDIESLTLSHLVSQAIRVISKDSDADLSELIRLVFENMTIYNIKSMKVNKAKSQNGIFLNGSRTSSLKLPTSQPDPWSGELSLACLSDWYGASHPEKVGDETLKMDSMEPSTMEGEFDFGDFGDSGAGGADSDQSKLSDCKHLVHYWRFEEKEGSEQFKDIKTQSTLLQGYDPSTVRLDIHQDLPFEPVEEDNPMPEVPLPEGHVVDIDENGHGLMIESPAKLDWSDPPQLTTELWINLKSFGGTIIECGIMNLRAEVYCTSEGTLTFCGKVINSDTCLDLNKWYSLSITAEEEHFQLYVNSSLVMDTPGAHAKPVNFGRPRLRIMDELAGFVAEIRVWKEVRSAEQIYHLMSHLPLLAYDRPKLTVSIHSKDCECERCVKNRQEASSIVKLQLGGAATRTLPSTSSRRSRRRTLATKTLPAKMSLGQSNVPSSLGATNDNKFKTLKAAKPSSTTIPDTLTLGSVSNQTRTRTRQRRSLITQSQQQQQKQKESLRTRVTSMQSSPSSSSPSSLFTSQMQEGLNHLKRQELNEAKILFQKALNFITKPSKERTKQKITSAHVYLVLTNLLLKYKSLTTTSGKGKDGIKTYLLLELTRLPIPHPPVKKSFDTFAIQQLISLQNYGLVKSLIQRLPHLPQKLVSQWKKLASNAGFQDANKYIKCLQCKGFSSNKHLNECAQCGVDLHICEINFLPLPLKHGFEINCRACGGIMRKTSELIEKKKCPLCLNAGCLKE
eukprot:TRINITY_DN1463_c0_g1_i1.p1 TRINITY_DN1463_c0_g1~~TRINITY_DN1463_c0_g1_i1.p1  ORF type:complete len:1825 (-),score=473.13 TRINITY_DN1463_c0_g1_i1:480-5954(-)